MASFCITKPQLLSRSLDHESLNDSIIYEQIGNFNWLKSQKKIRKLSVFMQICYVRIVRVWIAFKIEKDEYFREFYAPKVFLLQIWLI